MGDEKLQLLQWRDKWKMKWKARLYEDCINDIQGNGKENGGL